MSIQLSVATRNARLDAIATAIGASAKLLIFSGSVPGACSSADPSGLLATLSLPSTWLAAASGGVKVQAGSWTGAASAAGTAASFRIKDSALTTCHIQGTVGLAVGDLPLDNTNIASAQVITIGTVTPFSLTDANA
jgi:hypothetical protein